MTLAATHTPEKDLCSGALALDGYLAAHAGCGLTRDGVLAQSFHKGTKEFYTDASTMTRNPPVCRPALASRDLPRRAPVISLEPHT